MLEIDFRPPPSEVRQFGWIGLVAFPLVGLVLTRWLWELPQAVLWVALALAAWCGLFALLDLPSLIRPIFVGMQIIAWPIGLVVSTVLLGLIYFGLFTPLALLFRITGRDPMRRRLDATATSYWIVRDQRRPAASYFRLY